MKKIIRRFSIWLDEKTKAWVVPQEVWTYIDKKMFYKARKGLIEADRKFKGDPEIVKARVLIKRKELIGK